MRLGRPPGPRMAKLSRSLAPLTLPRPDGERAGGHDRAGRDARRLQEIARVTLDFSFIDTHSRTVEKKDDLFERLVGTKLVTTAKVAAPRDRPGGEPRLETVGPSEAHRRNRSSGAGSSGSSAAIRCRNQETRFQLRPSSHSVKDLPKRRRPSRAALWCLRA